jgi:putative flippase GtrA
VRRGVRVRSALLWGVVGVLSTLVAVLGYRLLVAPLSLGVGATALFALGVGAVVALASYLLEDRLARRARNGRS